MTERMAEVGRGITVAYDEIGDAAGEPLVLVAGLGQQLVSWPKPFCKDLADRGYRVIRFDNRDAGHSTHMGFRPPKIAAVLRGRWPDEQYDLDDMAADAIGLLDELGVADAHITGVSMGGMIAQTVAARYPKRVRSLTSIMSTTGAKRIGRPALSTWLLMSGKPARSRAEAEVKSVRLFRHIGSRGFPFDEGVVRKLAGMSWDRDQSSAGIGRQLGAIFRSGDRTAALNGVTAPTLVIHGDRDLMVKPTGGAATARAIPGARLETIRGMGHDLPLGAWPALLDLIDNHARRNSDATA